jgi:putative restriction endonuclease
MRFWVGLTDRDWFDFLASQPIVEEVNFWQPSARKPVDFVGGEPFLFKLKARYGGWVVGGGFWAHFTVLPARLAWDYFGQMNGAADLPEMERRVRRYRRDFDVHADHIGCIALAEPFFLPPDAWVAAPADWHPNIQVGRTYGTSDPIGADLWQRVELARVRSAGPSLTRDAPADGERYGSGMLVTPRLGQGAFRARVTDAYERRCAVTGERTLPVLQAAHIKPYSQLGPHSTENGLLLRSDLHTLFDRGYVTVTPQMELRVSRRIRDEFENGRDYYALERAPVRQPVAPYPPPARDYLEWHGDTIFRP